MTDLKPCPFCGVEPAIWSGSSVVVSAMKIGDDGVYLGHSLNSDECPFLRPTWFRTRDEAVAAWNRRAAPDGWERLKCCRCGKPQPVLVPCGNPNMEACPRCHHETTLEGRRAERDALRAEAEAGERYRAWLLNFPGMLRDLHRLMFNEDHTNGNRVGPGLQKAARFIEQCADEHGWGMKPAPPAWRIE